MGWGRERNNEGGRVYVCLVAAEGNMLANFVSNNLFGMERAAQFVDLFLL